MSVQFDVHVICLASKWASRGNKTVAHFARSSRVRAVHRSDAVTPATFPAPVEELAHPYALATIRGKQPFVDVTQLSDVRQIACGLSHIGLWRKCLADGRPLVVAEDDSDAKNLTRRLVDVAAAPLDADVVIVQCSRYPFKTDGVTAGASHCRRVVSFWGTGCYYVTPAGARKLLRHALPMTMHIDAYIRYCIGGADLTVYAVQGANDQPHHESTLVHRGIWTVQVVRQQFLLGATAAVALIIILVLSILLWRKRNR
jgi:GR25 family glycosyltransferase involved in LPS biosynthesis